MGSFPEVSLVAYNRTIGAHLGLDLWDHFCFCAQLPIRTQFTHRGPTASWVREAVYSSYSPALISEVEADAGKEKGERDHRGHDEARPNVQQEEDQDHDDRNSTSEEVVLNCAFMPLPTPWAKEMWKRSEVSRCVSSPLRPRCGLALACYGCEQPEQSPHDPHGPGPVQREHWVPPPDTPLRTPKER